MKFEMVLKMKQVQSIDVTITCEVLAVSRSGFYSWKGRPEAERTIENRDLVEKMKAIHAESRGTYGAPRLQDQLKVLHGRRCSKTRVARLMREAGLSGVAKARYRVKTTDSDHVLPIADRIFQVEEPYARRRAGP